MKKKTKIIKIDNKGQKRLRISLSIGFALLILLVLRLCILQFVQGASLKEEAVQRQLSSKVINPSRGTIYDSTGKILAKSTSVDTVYINPSEVKYKDKTEVNKEILAHKFSEIFELDYAETLEKLNTKTSSFKIVEKVDHEKIVSLQNWLSDNKIVSGIRIEDDNKRAYPYNNLASNLIGFTRSDGSGAMGLEYSLDNLLSGTAGKLLATTDSINGEIPNGEISYVPAQNGNDVTLTLDVNIQLIVEKYLSQSVIDNKADGGNVIVMNPSTGDVLAMATYPDYNLNTPYTINSNELKEKWDTLSSSDKDSALYKMWNNSAVQSTYEPGSTFKIITAATGLEEGIVTTDNRGDFYCAGSEQVSSVTMNCWRHNNPHGSESLRDALANSCNPAFIQLGRKIGAKTLYKYYRAFGLFNRTNPYFYGESNSVFFPENNINEFNVATMSFGQRFTITPIQLITAVSSIANEGVLMQPRIVKEIKNTDTNSVTTVEPKEIRQVVSKETADKLMDMLEYVVAEGTGKYARVQGYSVGGKTGTSEPLSGSEDEGYVASFIGLAPTVNTQVVVLVTIYNPKGDSYQGSQVAGPVVSQILSEVLPYLGIPSNNEIASSSTNSTYTTTTLPDVTGKTIAEARQILKDAGFSVKISSDEDASTTVITDQLPKPGVSLIKNSTVHLFTEKSNERTETTIPNFKGMSAASAINSAEASNLNLVINGAGIVIAQDVASGKTVEQGTVVTLTLQQETGGY